MAAEEKRVYMLTAKGSAELTGGRSSLSAAELRLLIMIDGIASVEEIAKRLPGEADAAALAKKLGALAKSGHVADPDASAAISVKDFFKDIDTSLQSLQANGFFVRIARRPESAKPAGDKHTILLIEDDEQLAKLLVMYLRMEQFTVRVAATRSDINKALREPPRPDLVLLDVVLPDADGFQILQKMRAHPQVKDVPIVLATAKATRESVLQGLQLGADGYVTKPYDVAALMTAVKTVLGMQ